MIKPILGLQAALVVACTFPIWGDTRNDLIAKIEAAGTNETEEYRHSVDVTGCAMTTYRWKNHEEKGWLLWSSFQFAMADTSFTPDALSPNQSFIGIETSKENDEFIMIVFKMREGTLARFERHVLRETEKPRQPSPRNDGTTHYYIQSDQFMITQQGPGIVAKARVFTDSYKQYVREHCQFVG